MIFARNGQCPLYGVERTLSECIATSQFDPEPTNLIACASSGTEGRLDFASACTNIDQSCLVDECRRQSLTPARAATRYWHLISSNNEGLRGTKPSCLCPSSLPCAMDSSAPRPDGPAPGSACRYRSRWSHRP